MNLPSKDWHGMLQMRASTPTLILPGANSYPFFRSSAGTSTPLSKHRWRMVRCKRTIRRFVSTFSHSAWIGYIVYFERHQAALHEQKLAAPGNEDIARVDCDGLKGPLNAIKYCRQQARTKFHRQGFASSLHTIAHSQTCCVLIHLQAHKRTSLRGIDKPL